MRTLERNKQKMYYSLYLGEQEIPVVDKQTGEVVIDYVDSEGNEYPRTEKQIVYSEPVEFKGNIAENGGEAEAVEFGVTVADYEAVLVMNKRELPIDETSLIWHLTKPVIMPNGYVDQYSADYRILKPSPSLNVAKYVLKKVVK